MHCMLMYTIVFLEQQLLNKYRYYQRTNFPGNKSLKNNLKKH